MLQASNHGLLAPSNLSNSTSHRRHGPDSGYAAKLLSQYSIIEGYERLHAVPQSAGSEAGKYVSDAGVDGVQMLAKKNDKGVKDI